MLTKEESLQLKGQAILIMIFLHLFNSQENISRCNLSITFLGRPLVSQLATFSEICVSLYLFLSGYGLYILYKKNNNIFPKKRIIKLYFTFWSSFIVFIPIGFICFSELYPNNFLTFIENITAWKTSYNWTWWFIFPYVMLLSITNLLFRCLTRWNFVTIFLFSSTIYIISYLVISLYKPYLLEFHILSNIFESLRMICIFMWGALFVKYDLFYRMKNLIKLNTIWNNILMTLIIFLLFILRSLIPIHAASVLYAVSFACCFYMMKKSSIIENFFIVMGKHSTNIWLIHAFFCWYYLDNFIYSFKYPIIIYLVTLFLSFLASFLVNEVYKLLFGKFSNCIR